MLAFRAWVQEAWISEAAVGPGYMGLGFRRLPLWHGFRRLGFRRLAVGVRVHGPGSECLIKGPNSGLGCFIELASGG